MTFGTLRPPPSVLQINRHSHGTRRRGSDLARSPRNDTRGMTDPPATPSSCHQRKRISNPGKENETQELSSLSERAGMGGHCLGNWERAQSRIGCSLPARESGAGPSSSSPRCSSALRTRRNPTPCSSTSTHGAKSNPSPRPSSAASATSTVRPTDALHCRYTHPPATGTSTTGQLVHGRTGIDIRRRACFVTMRSGSGLLDNWANAWMRTGCRCMRIA